MFVKKKGNDFLDNSLSENESKSYMENKRWLVIFFQDNEHVLHYLAQIRTYQVTDWSKGPKINDSPHGI